MDEFSYSILLIGIFICLLLLIFLVVMVRRPDWFTDPAKKSGPNEFPSQQEAKDLTAIALKKLNVNQLEFTPTDYGWAGHYDYQAGHFIVTYSQRDNSYLNIVFPGIADYPVAYIDALRAVTNRANSVDTAVRYFYILDEEHDEAIVHSSVQIANTRNVDEFVKNAEHAMADLFNLRRSFAETMKDAIQTTDSNHVNDVEYSHATDKRVEYLMLKGFMEFNDIFLKYRQVPLEQVADTSMEEWLSTMGFLKDAKLLDLRFVVGDKVKLLRNEEDIRNFTLAEAVKATEEQDTDEQPLIQIRYTPVNYLTDQEDKTEQEEKETPVDASNKPLDQVRSLNLCMACIRKTEKLDFYKVNYLVAADDTLGDTANCLMFAQNEPKNGSFIFVLNKMDQKKMDFEVSYILQDALDKMDEGKSNELSEEQKIMINLFMPEVNFCIYWGHRYMRSQCYLQALLMFRRAWAIQNKHYMSLQSAGKSTYHNICYWMGGCLYKLGLYQQAYYYLSIVSDLGVIDYSKMNVKCLRALKDPRSLTYILKVTEEVNTNMNELNNKGEEIPASLSQFLCYLDHEQLAVIMEAGVYSAAESLCHSMIERNEDVEFAQEQLAIIDKMKKKLADDLNKKKKDKENKTEGKDTPDDLPKDDEA